MIKNKRQNEYNDKRKMFTIDWMRYQKLVYIKHSSNFCNV